MNCLETGATSIARKFYLPPVYNLGKLTRAHDLKHTVGRRLRAAGVPFEDRQDLLGHRSGRITTHYSAAELENLTAAAKKVYGQDSRKSPALVLLKQKAVSGITLTA